MTDIASRDPNRVPTTQGVSSADFSTPTNVAVNPTTHGWVVDTSDVLISGQVALKITEVGQVMYLAIANPGTTQATAAWSAKKIDRTTGVLITWADGNSNFDNVATDLTLLSYS